METIHVKFDELTEQIALAHIVQVLVVSASTPSSTTIDQDAPSTKPSSEESSSGDVSSAESTQVIQPHNHLRKWSKDHVSPKLNRSLQPAKGDSQLI
ncbi:hypothetical protein Tco_1205143 [Tanacetum coccineum]